MLRNLSLVVHGEVPTHLYRLLLKPRDFLPPGSNRTKRLWAVVALEAQQAKQGFLHPPPALKAVLQLAAQKEFRLLLLNELDLRALFPPPRRPAAGSLPLTIVII